MSLAFLLRTAQDQIENQVEEEQKKLKIKFGQEEEKKQIQYLVHPTNKRTAPGPGKFFAR